MKKAFYTHPQPYETVNTNAIQLSFYHNLLVNILSTR